MLFLSLFIFVLINCVTSRTLSATENGIERLKAQIKKNEHIYLNNISVPFASDIEGQFVHDGITATVLGRTSLCDPGVCARIIDVVGVVNMNTGRLDQHVILDSVVEEEIVSDGLSGYDQQNNQAFYVSDGAFGGTVFYAQTSTFTPLPPTSYYLNPVSYLGFDPVSGSRIIAGLNVKTNFLIFEKPNWGEVTYFEMPNNIPLTANLVYDGSSMSLYNFFCPFPNPCQLMIWNINKNTTTNKGALPCMSKSTYLAGPLWINPSMPGRLQGLVYDQDEYAVITINPTGSGQWCTISGPLAGMPPKPRIVISTTIGLKSSNLYVSVTGDGYSGVNVYDSKLNLLQKRGTNQLYEDIYVSEM